MLRFYDFDAENVIVFTNEKEIDRQEFINSGFYARWHFIGFRTLTYNKDEFNRFVEFAETIQGRFSIGNTSIHFENKADAMNFKLMFG